MLQALYSFLILVLLYGAAFALTVAIETPVILRGSVTKNRAYIRSVNLVTNILLNMILTGILLFLTRSADQDRVIKIAFVWFLLAELVLIPVSEALLYRIISAAGTKRIFLFTYLANLASCSAGLALTALLRVLI